MLLKLEIHGWFSIGEDFQSE